ncbi:MAG TPA: ankyrin repeat domain-containing protein [Puia sp.]|nr:ankyrin repeat domain-containing protein [Puia sp.]
MGTRTWAFLLLFIQLRAGPGFSQSPSSQGSTSTAGGNISLRDIISPPIFLAGDSTSTARGSTLGDSILTERLFRALRSGRADSLDLLLKAGAPVNTTRHGYSPLMTATLAGSLQQMKLLIDYGADVNYADPDSITALWYAVPDPERTRLLLDHGANPNLRCKEGYNVAIKAVMFPGTTEILDLLVAHGVELKSCARHNELLYTAAATTDTLLTARLLAAGFRPNDTTAGGDYPIFQATGYRCFANVKQLVEHGADVDVQYHPGRSTLFSGLTPIMLAALVGDTLTMRYLLDHGARLNVQMTDGTTALMYLQQSETDLPEMTRLFLDKGADPAARTIDGSTALSYALRKGNTVSVGLLKEKLSASSKN